MITKPSIARLARRAGVKSLSEDSYKEINDFIDGFLNKILKAIFILSKAKNNRTILTDDIYDTLEILGYNLSRSTEISNSSYTN